MTGTESALWRHKQALTLRLRGVAFKLIKLRCGFGGNSRLKGTAFLNSARFWFSLYRWFLAAKRRWSVATGHHFLFKGLVVFFTYPARPGRPPASGRPQGMCLSEKSHVSPAGPPPRARAAGRPKDISFTLFSRAPEVLSAYRDAPAGRKVSVVCFFARVPGVDKSTMSTVYGPTVNI